MSSSIRGNIAGLLANLDSDSDSDSEGAQSKKTGIYSSMLSVTKREVKDTHQKLDLAEKQILKTTNKENILTNNSNAKSKIGQKNNNESNSESDCKTVSDSDDEVVSTVDRKKFKSKKEEVVKGFSPPPPPSHLNTQRLKKNSSLDKQLRELETIKYKTSKLVEEESLNSSNLSDNCNLELELNTITVRVSTKHGVHKWEIKNNEPFLTIFEKLSKIENAPVENVLLMLKDRRIQTDDTPNSVNLKIYDILDCGKLNTAPQERIRIIENDEEITASRNLIVITLQTQEGRKSRVKFLIQKNEKFGEILKKYCEKRKLADDSNSYMMEFDGDKVDPNETPNDLDLDGDEIFDVKKSAKPSLAHINENKKNYEFDDDILIA